MRRCIQPTGLIFRRNLDALAACLADDGMIPKLRLDALTDGVFAVAMTLLVIDLRLSEALFVPAIAGHGIDDRRAGLGVAKAFEG